MKKSLIGIAVEAVILSMVILISLTFSAGFLLAVGALNEHVLDNKEKQLELELLRGATKHLEGVDVVANRHDPGMLTCVISSNDFENLKNIGVDVLTHMRNLYDRHGGNHNWFMVSVDNNGIIHNQVLSGRIASVSNENFCFRNGTLHTAVATLPNGKIQFHFSTGAQ